ncbi:MAG: ParB N-terminal domain-containing protein [Pseudomonadota bacterium]
MPDPVRIQKITEVPVAEVAQGDRQRPLSEAAVAALVTSIEAEGLQNPIIVRRVPKKGDRPAGFTLISGAHRLAAAQQLGWVEIPAAAYECSVAQARAMEIDENLIRRELAPLDLAVGLVERKALHEALHPETRAGTFKGNRHTGSLVNDKMSFTTFATLAAENTGLSKRHIERLVRAGTAILDVGIAQFRTLPAPPKVGELMRFADLGPKDRARVAEALTAGTHETIDAAIEGLSSAPKAKVTFLRKFSDTWTRISKAERKTFVATHRAEFRRILDDLDAEDPE